MASQGGSGIFKSRDHRFPVNPGLDNLSMFGLVMDPRNPAVLNAYGLNGVYKTWR